jgi:hypothetical protein
MNFASIIFVLLVIYPFDLRPGFHDVTQFYPTFLPKEKSRLMRLPSCLCLLSTFKLIGIFSDIQ